jgi:hypothetical protein
MRGQIAILLYVISASEGEASIQYQISFEMN